MNVPIPFRAAIIIALSGNENSIAKGGKNVERCSTCLEPKPKKIKLWAYSDMEIPGQDWELAVNCFENIPMICSFVDDEKCKPIHFFSKQPLCFYQ